MSCKCAELNNLTVVDMAHPEGALDAFEEVASRGQPYWWLEASRCTSCGTSWLVGHEERQNDVFVLRRLREEELTAILAEHTWPQDFDRYEVLLQHGQEAGHSVRWVDPIADSSLLETVVDLARERPGIRVSEMCALLNIDVGLAMQLAELAHATSAVEITNDINPWR
jgi:hypothetical protein